MVATPERPSLIVGRSAGFIGAMAAARRLSRPRQMLSLTAMRSVFAIDGIAFEQTMATLTIHNLDPAIKERLRTRAAEHGHSMEAEARHILQTTPRGATRARFAPLGGVELALPPRTAACEPPTFG